MSLFHAVVLAMVQGLTEFLPVSSSAHLVLIPWLLHWPDGGMAFDVALHAGTLVAVILYFLGTWVTLTLNGFGIRYPAEASEQQFRVNQRLFWFLVAGTIPGAMVGFLFEGFIERTLRNPALIACALIALALVMAAADSVSRLDRRHGTINTQRLAGGGVARRPWRCFPVSRVRASPSSRDCGGT